MKTNSIRQVTLVIEFQWDIVGKNFTLLVEKNNEIE